LYKEQGDDNCGFQIAYLPQADVIQFEIDTPPISPTNLSPSLPILTLKPFFHIFDLLQIEILWEWGNGQETND